MKTKPTQHSVKELREIGIQPDVVLCRADRTLSDGDRRKIALFTNLTPEAVIPALDTDSIYKIPGALHAEGLDAIVCKKLHMEPAPADLGGVEPAGRRAAASGARSQYRDGRQVRRSDRVVQIAVRGAHARRHSHAKPGEHPLRGLRGGRARGDRLSRRDGRDPRPWRLRQARRRRQDPGNPLRARERHPLSRDMPRHAARGHRIRAAHGGARRREQHRVRSRHAAPGRRADHRVAESRRLGRAARGELRHGRHDAPRRAAVRSRPGIARSPDLRRNHGVGATSASLRSEQPLPPAPRSCGPCRRGADPERGRRRSVRDDRASGSPVVFRLSVPPRVHVEPAARPSVVHRLHSRCARAAKTRAGARGRTMRLPSSWRRSEMRDERSAKQARPTKRAG